MADDGALQALVEQAVEYALPLQVIAATRWRAVADAANPERHAPNTLKHLRRLADHRSRWITAPNNDTLYSNAWLDLSAGPLRLRVATQPAGRYWSIALMDAFSNHFAMLGQRLDGCGPVDVLIAGPRDHDVDTAGPATRVIRAPGDDAWLFARCLVDGPEDLPQAHAMQDRITLHPTVDALLPLPGAPGALDDPPAFLATVNALLARNPAPAADAPLLQRCARIGLCPGQTDVWSRLDEPVRAAWTAHMDGAMARVRLQGAQGRRNFQGWIAAAADIGNFGCNYALRASVALGGLGALEPDEAMYFVCYADADGAALDGRHRYRLELPAQGIPTDSFWSFTMYQATPDGRRFFVDNPIGRYAIGNRTPGLHWADDGSLALLLQQAAPDGPAALANWLPAPASGFQIALRCYLPRAELRQGLAAMPRIVRL
ncbi:MAG: DUF1254 domain-containing protein [Burkholderiaceae bacterium]|nr:DUF1254 domain-containing protein [Burkholderiaceae bacterium]